MSILTRSLVQNRWFGRNVKLELFKQIMLWNTYSLNVFIFSFKKRWVFFSKSPIFRIVCIWYVNKILERARMNDLKEWNYSSGIFAPDESFKYTHRSEKKIVDHMQLSIKLIRTWYYKNAQYVSDFAVDVPKLLSMFKFNPAANSPLNCSLLFFYILTGLMLALSICLPLWLLVELKYQQSKSELYDSISFILHKIKRTQKCLYNLWFFFFNFWRSLFVWR